MTLVTGITLPNDGDAILAANYNDPITKILAAVNGSIDSTNITTASLPWEVMASFTNKIPASALKDSANIETYRSETNNNFVANGCVWSATSGLAATMTAGVVYVSGVRVAVSSIATHTFTASKDTYVSVSNTGTVSYTEVANNANSPSLPANSIWLAIVITGASTVSSINSGNLAATAPTVSSRVLKVSDTNGNLIRPSYNQKILGYAEITTTASTSGNPTAVAGLTAVVIVPDGKEIEVTAFTPQLYNSNNASNSDLTIWDGTVGTGTKVALARVTSAGSNYGASANARRVLSPGAVTKTYNVAIGNVGGGTANALAETTDPAFLMVTLK